MSKDKTAADRSALDTALRDIQDYLTPRTCWCNDDDVCSKCVVLGITYRAAVAIKRQHHANDWKEPLIAVLTPLLCLDCRFDMTHRREFCEAIKAADAVRAFGRDVDAKR